MLRGTGWMPARGADRWGWHAQNQRGDTAPSSHLSLDGRVPLFAAGSSPSRLSPRRSVRRRLGRSPSPAHRRVGVFFCALRTSVRAAGSPPLAGVLPPSLCPVRGSLGPRGLFFLPYRTVVSRRSVVRASASTGAGPLGVVLDSPVFLWALARVSSESVFQWVFSLLSASGCSCA